MKASQEAVIGEIGIIPLPAFNDNYIWLLRLGSQAAVIDPGDAAVVERYLAEHDLQLETVLITHHHADHVGGVERLRTTTGALAFGPADARVPRDRTVADGDTVTLFGDALKLNVLAVPGHTETHVAYYGGDMLFCGDTLFSAGCGRLLGGSARQLHQSLLRLSALPEQTRVYCTHEYTLSNLRFARAVEPRNPERDAWTARCEALRQRNLPTLPSTIARERQINPFLRVGQAQIAAALDIRTGAPLTSDEARFAALRAWKDGF